MTIQELHEKASRIILRVTPDFKLFIQQHYCGVDEPTYLSYICDKDIESGDVKAPAKAIHDLTRTFMRGGIHGRSAIDLISVIRQAVEAYLDGEITSAEPQTTQQQ